MDRGLERRMELTVDGKYRLKKKIGSGTFGVIYLGESGRFRATDDRERAVRIANAPLCLSPFKRIGPENT